MRIVRFMHNGRAVYGALTDESMAFIIAGDILGKYELTDELVEVGQLLAPIIPTDILAIGLNYHAHAKETGGTVPENPMLFIKASNSLSNPNDPIVLPNNSEKVDYEAELVIVIGKDAKNVSRESALDYVLGYTIGNDVSARDWQKEPKLNGGQFARGKSFDTFAPIGPWITTREAIPDVDSLDIKCVINGETMQSSNTRDMIFSVADIVSSLSTTMTVRAGSIIFTGTPEGVGAARKPPRFLKAGDVVEVVIEKIGTLKNSVILSK